MKSRSTQHYIVAGKAKRIEEIAADLGQSKQLKTNLIIERIVSSHVGCDASHQYRP